MTLPVCEVDGEEDERDAGGEAALHHLALVFGLYEEAGLGWGTGAVGCGGVVGGGYGCVAAEVFGGVVFVFVVGSGGQSLVGVDGGDAGACGEGRELCDFAGVEIGLIDRAEVGFGIGFGEEDAVGLVADDDGVDGVTEVGWSAGGGVGGARRVGYEEAGLAGGEVEGVDAVGGVVDHQLAVGGVGVDVEVEAGGAGLVGEANDAVAGVLVDP